MTSEPVDQPIPASPDAGAPTPLRLFLLFSRIGLTSFGGGLHGWFLYELVTRRRWLSEDETGCRWRRRCPA